MTQNCDLIPTESFLIRFTPNSDNSLVWNLTKLKATEELVPVQSGLEPGTVQDLVKILAGLKRDLYWTCA